MIIELSQVPHIANPKGGNLDIKSTYEGIEVKSTYGGIEVRKTTCNWCGQKAAGN